MADTKTSALVALTGLLLASNDLLPVVDVSAAATKSITIQELLTGILGSTSITGATETTSKPLLDVAQTWNAAGVTFTGLRLNISASASAAASLLMDLQVGGVSKFLVGKNGVFGCSATSLGFQDNAGPSLISTVGIIFKVHQTSYDIRMHNLSPLGWTATDAAAAIDLSLYRDAANILAQRNGVNAQTFRIYSTFTDASNYQRLTHAWNTTTALIKNEGAGTGADGSVAFNNAALATNATKGFVMLPSCAGPPSGTPADIPTGQVPWVYDSTNFKIYVYSGGAWKSTAALA